MKNIVLILSCALLSATGAAARAESASHNKHVVELFTSQSCYSCPPAERLLGKLIESRTDVVALEFHVDYWNDLRYGSAGTWSDPFSDSHYSQRQRHYQARGLDGNNGVYTPQAVVDGKTALVGSNKRELDELLMGRAPMAADLALERGPGAMRVSVSEGASGGPKGPAEVWLYKFDLRRVTDIGGGENSGKALTNHNIVREMRRLGVWNGGSRAYSVKDLELEDGQGCAVVVQGPGQGPVLGAELCPS